ncbi:MAG: amidohydrolase family protein [Gemmobacter sp.]|nr:amidohydrolase family protein [Gemmobacter sp.]
MTIRIDADLILHNGRIWCGRTEGHAEAVAIWQGKVLAVGTSTDILELVGVSTQVIDLEGRFASPGLIDNHLHLISTGLVMGMVNVTPTEVPTLAAMKAAIAARATTAPQAHRDLGDTGGDGECPATGEVLGRHCRSAYSE